MTAAIANQRNHRSAGDREAPILPSRHRSRCARPGELVARRRESLDRGRHGAIVAPNE